MRRVLDETWFLPAFGVTVGGLALAGLTVADAPRWIRWISGAVVALAVVAPALPLVVLLPWHFIAVRNGRMMRSKVPCAVSLAAGALIVDRGARQMRYDLARICRARRAQNDNWTESTMLEDALGLFCGNGRELVRVPLTATGVEALVLVLVERGVPIDDVRASAPAFLD